MKIGRMVGPAIATHAALTKTHGVATEIQDTAPLATHEAAKTGVHAVGAAYLAKTSQSDQTLSDAEIPAAIARNTEVVDAIGFHAAIPTAHQNAPALIAAHAALFTGLHGQVMVIKPDDQIVNNSETLVNDEDLVIPVGIDEVWLILVVFFCQASTTTPDFDWLFAVPTNGAIRGLKGMQFVSIDGLEDLTVEYTITNVGAPETFMFFMGLYVGGDTAGNLQLQWAQNVATVEDTKLKTNSLIIAHRIA